MRGSGRAGEIAQQSPFSLNAEGAGLLDLPVWPRPDDFAMVRVEVAA